MEIQAYKETNYYPGVQVWFFKVRDGGSVTTHEMGTDYEKSLVHLQDYYAARGVDIKDVVIQKGQYVTTWVPDATR